MQQERPVEHDSGFSIVACNTLPISERVSGSGRTQLYRLDVAQQAYQTCFAADVLGNDRGQLRLMHGLTFLSNQVGLHSDWVRRATAVELVCASRNSTIVTGAQSTS
jgi:hypothetical protein